MSVTVNVRVVFVSVPKMTKMLNLGCLSEEPPEASLKELVKNVRGSEWLPYPQQLHLSFGKLENTTHALASVAGSRKSLFV